MIGLSRRHHFCVLALAALVFLPVTELAGQELEVGFDRPGADYRDFELARPDPELCRTACMNESECRAWTYLKPERRGEKAHCFLKSEAPEPVENDLCISGIRPAGRVDEQGMEPDTNRPGGDFLDFEPATSDPVVCRQACDRESRCRAWTYVRPTAEGDPAHCWLKNTVPDAVVNEECISGVKTTAKTLPKPAPTPERWVL